MPQLIADMIQAQNVGSEGVGLDVTPSGEGTAVIAGICALARVTGRTVIVEGIEHPYQAELLYGRVLTRPRVTSMAAPALPARSA